MAMKHQLTPGMRFGHLQVIKEGPVLRLPSGQINRTAECICDCGNMKIVRIVHLFHSKSTSCGCGNGIPNREKSHPLYIRWKAINYRCHHIKNGNCYTRKSITVCDEWRDSYIKFKSWALSHGYKDGLTIDRINNNEGYSPGNCRFITNQQNCNNRDNTFYVIYQGERKPFMELIYSKNLLLHMHTIRERIKRGWNTDEAFNKPIREGNYKRVNYTLLDMCSSMNIKFLLNGAVPRLKN